MFTTLAFLYVLGFILWMNTSKRAAWKNRNPLFQYLFKRPVLSRCLFVFIFIVLTILCICKFGLGAGIFASVVFLMLAGNFAVLLLPLHYLNLKKMIVLYFLFLFVELGTSYYAGT